eukprot:COSAG01_NODE_2484_length_7600_cov_2.596587_4_plen_108_part_00
MPTEREVYTAAAAAAACPPRILAAEQQQQQKEAEAALPAAGVLGERAGGRGYSPHPRCGGRDYAGHPVTWASRCRRRRRILIRDGYSDPAAAAHGLSNRAAEALIMI